MDFLLSDDLKEFREVLRKFFDSEISSTKMRASINRDEQLWGSIAELGALMAAVPEEYDGLSFGSIASQVVIEESARRLCPVPLFETLTQGIAPLTLLGNTEAAKDLLKKSATGEVILTGAFEGLWGNQLEAVAYKKDKLTGVVDFVSSVEAVDKIIVPATSDKKLALYAVDVADVSFEKKETFDVIRSYYSVTFKDSPATLLSDSDVSPEDLQTLLDVMQVHAVAEMVGALDFVLELTVEYVKTRQQFGKPIGSFQAIQHKLADIYLVLQEVQSLGRFAAWCIDEDREQLAEAAASAKAYASETVPEAIESALQAHGGIGFTYEYDLHLFLRRAKMLSVLFGEKDTQYLRLSEKAVRHGA